MNNLRKKILTVSPDKARRRYISHIFYKSGYLIKEVSDYKIAYEELLLDVFDVILVDVSSNIDSGLELINKIRIVNKTIIIFAFVNIGEPEVCNKAMKYGANRYFVPPYYNDILLRSLELEISDIEKKKEIINSGKQKSPFVAVGIVASTGGPLTLEKIISDLEFTDKAVFLIVLHAPAWMLKQYTERINNLTGYNVVLAEHGMKISAGTIYFAPGNYHMKVTPSQKIELNQDAPVNFVRPSADPLFKSIAEVFPNASIGVILTGMGHDGTAGAAYISKAGGRIIVQSPDTAVIHAMPLSTINSGLADKIVDVENLPEEIISEALKIYRKNRSR